MKTHEISKMVGVALLAALSELACASTGSGVGGQTHFACEVDADCREHIPDGVCIEGECAPRTDAMTAGGGACGGSPLVGKYMWKVGNCEQGALTPFDPKTCESTICGGNARTLDECTGTHLATYRIDGLNVAIDGVPSLVFSRTVDCTNVAPADRATCERRACFLSHVDLLYTTVGSPGPLHPDDFWLATDRPWQGVQACGASPEMTAIDPSVCADGGVDAGSP